MTTVTLGTCPVWNFANYNGTPLVGGLLYSYLAGTTTPAATYTDSTGSTQNTNPIVLNAHGDTANSSGSATGVYWPPYTGYKFILTDAAGNQLWSQDNVYAPLITPTPLPNSITDAMLATNSVIYAIDQTYMRTAAEIAAGVTPTNYGYPPGDIRRYGAVADSGTTNNTAAIQNAITANANYYPIIIDYAGSGFYGGIAGPITVPSGTHIIFRNNAEIRWASTTSTGPTIGGSATRPGFNITGSHVTIEGDGVITGPSGAGVFTGLEIGIVSVGTSAASPYSDIVISGLELRWWGSDGIELKWCSQVWVQNNYIHDCGYAGMHFLTCTGGVVNGNEVGPIAPGSAGNAYGISCTFDGAASPTNSRSDANHFCIAFDVGFNYVHDIPLWIGLDAHGGFELDYHDNKVYNCWTGIQIASGNGYGGENNSITNNVVNINQANGMATTVVAATSYGITINGGGTGAGQYHIAPKVIGNTIVGYGNDLSPPTGWSIQATWTDSAVIADNIFKDWIGYGIYSAASIGGKISGNVFRARTGAYASAACIYIATITAGGPWYIEGNKHTITSGTAAVFGLAWNTANGAGVLRGNDFSSATTAQYGNSVGGTLSTAYFSGQLDPLVLGASGSPIQYKLKGTATFSAATTVAVSFGVTLSGTGYQVYLGGNAAGYVWPTAKTTTGFTLNCSSSNSNATDWSVEL